MSKASVATTATAILFVNIEHQSVAVRSQVNTSVCNSPFTAQVKSKLHQIMRLSYVLLVAASVLLAVGNAASIEVDAGTRSLRSHHNKAQDEERAFYHTFNFNLYDDIFNALPNQFQRMRKQPSYLRQTFKNWRSGMGTPSEAVAYMKNQGLSQKAIDQFEDAFKSYLKHKRAKGK